MFQDTFITNFIYYTPQLQSKTFDNSFFPLSSFIYFQIQFYAKDSMPHEVSDEVSWNALPHEGKRKILYNNDENTILYNEYMVKIV